MHIRRNMLLRIKNGQQGNMGKNPLTIMEAIIDLYPCSNPIIDLILYSFSTYIPTHFPFIDHYSSRYIDSQSITVSTSIQPFMHIHQSSFIRWSPFIAFHTYFHFLHLAIPIPPPFISIYIFHIHIHIGDIHLSTYSSYI